MREKSTQYWPREPFIQKKEDSYAAMGETLSSFGDLLAMWLDSQNAPALFS